MYYEKVPKWKKYAFGFYVHLFVFKRNNFTCTHGCFFSGKELRIGMKIGTREIKPVKN